MEPKLTPVKLQHSVAVIFTGGVFFGLYIITVCFANRWLIFADGGWKFRKRVSWSMVTIVNILGLMTLANVSVSLWSLMSETAFVEAGHRPEDYVDPPWDAVVKVKALFCDCYSESF